MLHQASRACAAAALFLSWPCGLTAAAPQVRFPGEQLFVPGQTLSAQVVAGDLDGDGRDDLVRSSDAARLGLFRGLASGDVAPYGSVPLAGRPQEIALAHLDADGRLDLLVVVGGVLATAAGDGQGGFAPLAPFPTAGRVQGLATGDVDGDGRTDVLLSIGGQNPGVAVHLQLAQGGFAPAQVSGIARYPRGLCTGFFDGDSALDLAICDDYFKSVRIALGDGHGGFTLHGWYETYHSTLSPRFVAAGRIAGGFVDLVVGGAAGEPGWLLIGMGDGSFSFVPGFPAFGRPQVVDWNGDGLDDVVSVGYVLQVTLGSSSWFFLPKQLPAPAVLASAVPCDVDGDGRVDLAFASASQFALQGLGDPFATVGVLLGNGAGGVRGLVVTPPVFGSGLAHQLAADLDADGDPDVVSAIGADLVVQRGDGSGGHLPPEPMALPAGAIEAALGDFGGDALPDIVVRDSAQQVRVLINHGTSFQAQAPGPTGVHPAHLAAGDLDGDGDDDVVVGDPSAGVAALLNDGTGAFGAPVGSQVDVPPSTFLFELEDLDSDGRADLVVVARQQGAWTWKGQGDGRFLPWTYRPLPAAAGAAALGDLNADGVADLAVAYSDANACMCYANTLTILPGDGQGGWQAAQERIWTGLGASALHLVDLDGDGNVDVLADLRREVALLRGDGAFGFERAVHFASFGDFGYSGRTLVSGDANGDGKLDLVRAFRWFPFQAYLALAVMLQE